MSDPRSAAGSLLEHSQKGPSPGWGPLDVKIYVEVGESVRFIRLRS